MNGQELDHIYDNEHTPTESQVAKLALTLYYLLQQLTSGAPFTIVRSVRSGQGFEAYRLIARRYERTSRLTTVSSIAKAVTTKFNEETFEQ